MISILETIFIKGVTFVFRAASPLLQSRLAKVLTRFVGDVPRIGTTWVVNFTDLTPSVGAEYNAIDARLEQYGYFVVGTGHVQGSPEDPFEYFGIVKHNALYGSFRRKGGDVLAGTGSFVLKLSADQRSMTGMCSWYENTIDGIWGSEYLWIRKG